MWCGSAADSATHTKRPDVACADVTYCHRGSWLRGSTGPQLSRGPLSGEDGEPYLVFVERGGQMHQGPTFGNSAQGPHSNRTHMAF